MNTTLTADTAATIERFNEAFRLGDRDALAAVVHDDCIMVSTQPAPDGTAFIGKAASLAFWYDLMADPATSFEVDRTFCQDDWACVLWRFRFGPTDAESVLGVNVTRVQDGQVIEQLGYTKTPGEALPLPEAQAATSGSRS